MSERPNSYLLDTESPAEMARLINLDQMTAEPRPARRYQPGEDRTALSPDAH